MQWIWFFEGASADHKESIERALIALNEAAQKGITMIHDAGSSAAASGCVSCIGRKRRIAGANLFNGMDARRCSRNSCCKQGPCKLSSVLGRPQHEMMMDGALGSRGASMLEPYSDDPGKIRIAIGRRQIS